MTLDDAKKKAERFQEYYTGLKARAVDLSDVVSTGPPWIEILMGRRMLYQGPADERFDKWEYGLQCGFDYALYAINRKELPK